MKRRICMAVFVITIGIAVSSVWAGRTLDITCENNKCRFDGSVSFGGGKLFELMTGYCVTCSKFVYLSWTREGTEHIIRRRQGEDAVRSKPVPIGRIWNATTGRTNALYACPTCTNAFLQISSDQNLHCCPKCGQASLKKRIVAFYD